MNVIVGSDERTALTDRIVADLREMGHVVDTVGALAGTDDEWASVGTGVGRAVASATAEVGVLFCWTGTGASIAANKVPGVRAALCADADTARMARRYNHANVLVMSLRLTSETVGSEILTAFLESPDGDEEFDLRNVAELGRLDGSTGQ